MLYVKNNLESEENMPTGPNISSEKIELIDSATVLKSMTEKTATGPLQLLAVHGKSLGYTLATSPKDTYGTRHTIRAVEAVNPPPGEKGLPIQEVSLEFHVQNFTKARSKDQGALVSITIRAGNNVETREMLLDAPGGDFSQAKEYFVKDNKVIPAKSWWTAVLACLRKNCITVCVSSLIGCTGTWAAYLACVAVACGGCWVKCLACAGCNCKWWCKWAVGCCKQ